MKNLLVGIYILVAVCIGFAEDSAQATAQPQLGEVALGNPIQYGRLDYPKQALSNHIQGAVVLKLLVAKSGKVKNVSVVRVTHHCPKQQSMPYASGCTVHISLMANPKK